VGELLYVGISLSAINRLSQHKTSGWFLEIAKVDIEQFETRILALAAESKSIFLDKPKYNKNHNKNIFEIDDNDDGAIYYCLASRQDGCDMCHFTSSIKFIKKPPRCPQCGSKSSFEGIW
jgi:predicted Zn-ribbon and HTH transcriptional regulator